MKKAKMMLFAITVLAIVSGTYAFKAHLYGGRLYYTTNPLHTNCNLPVDNLTLNPNGNVFAGKAYYTIVFGAPCPEVPIYVQP